MSLVKGGTIQFARMNFQYNAVCSSCFLDSSVSRNRYKRGGVNYPSRNILLRLFTKSLAVVPI